MNYRILSRGELLKALQDHATAFSPEGTIEWKDDLDCYCLSLNNSTRIFIDRFEENQKLGGGMITLFKVIKISAYDLSFDVMLGVISSHDWMVGIPEEGEE